MTEGTAKEVPRRQFLQHAVLGTALAGVAIPNARGAAEDSKSKSPQDDRLVRNRFWMWAHDSGVHNEGWGIPKPSRITPVEAAYYMGVPNLIVVRYRGIPPMPFDQYAIPFRSLREVVWSVVGAGGRSDEAEREHVLDLAGRMPNIAGIMMDDFFAGAFVIESNEVAVLSLDQLRDLRSMLKLPRKELKLWAVLYEHQLDKPVGPYIELLDKVNFWTWYSKEIPNLERNFEQVEKMAPNADKVLGLYMWDYQGKKALPIELMQHQCELGLKWLKQGRIEGMVFLATCICDLELETVEWTREWIAKAGSEVL